jgi:hypothetical protein
MSLFLFENLLNPFLFQRPLVPSSILPSALCTVDLFRSFHSQQLFLASHFFLLHTIIDQRNTPSSQACLTLTSCYERCTAGRKHLPSSHE